MRGLGVGRTPLSDVKLSSCLCELVWGLARGYRISPAEIEEAIPRLTNGANVLVNCPAVQAGLNMLEAGGDFADCVIAFEGRWLGADFFPSTRRP